MVVADGNANLVRNVSATLQILGDPATCPTCVKTELIGDFLGTGTPQTDQLGDLGMSFALDFSPSEVVQVGIPLLITSDIAPAYFFAASGYPFDPVDGLYDGINPIASFLDASFTNDSNDPPAFHADLAIAADGSTILSESGAGAVHASVAHRRFDGSRLASAARANRLIVGGCRKGSGDRGRDAFESVGGGGLGSAGPAPPAGVSGA